MLCKFVEYKLSVLNEWQAPQKSESFGKISHYATLRCLLCHVEGVNAFISEPMFIRRFESRVEKRSGNVKLSYRKRQQSEMCANEKDVNEHNHNNLWLIKQDIKESLLII